MKLRVVIAQDVSGYYLAEVPALPGCLSQGKPREEAIANIKEATVAVFSGVDPTALHVPRANEPNGRRIEIIHSDFCSGS